jgi:hypothetical protein
MGFKYGWEKHFYKDLQTPISRKPLPIRKEPIVADQLDFVNTIATEVA